MTRSLRAAKSVPAFMLWSKPPPVACMSSSGGPLPASSSSTGPQRVHDPAADRDTVAVDLQVGLVGDDESDATYYGRKRSGNEDRLMPVHDLSGSGRGRVAIFRSTCRHHAFTPSRASTTVDATAAQSSQSVAPSATVPNARCSAGP